MKTLFFVTFFILSTFVTATIINVPADYPTIQEGIDAAVDGDSVLVATGSYLENISILQKYRINVIGSGADVTMIDGGENGHVVVFNHASGSIRNFTITNSGNDPLYSAGIFTSQSRVVIDSNIITNNNFGIRASSSSEVFIHGNKIINNSGYSAIDLLSSTGFISYNLVSNNISHGIYNYYSSPNIQNNTIVGNNNTFALMLNPTESQTIRNNIIINFEFGIYVQGGQQSAVPLLEISYNDLWNNSSANYWETYGNIYSQPFLPQPGIGEIHENPLFLDPSNGDYHLQMGSPCIDAGDPNFPLDPDGTIVDMGAYYFHQGTGVDDEFQITNYELQNFPNPFNPSTTISFELNTENTELIIYNIKGQKIKKLHTSPNQSSHKATTWQAGLGTRSVVWDGTDENNQPVSSGIYFYQLNIDGKTNALRKMLLMK